MRFTPSLMAVLGLSMAIFPAAASAVAPAPDAARGVVRADDDEGGDNSPEDAKGDAKTVLKTEKLPDSAWSGEYLEDVAAAMKPGKVGVTKARFSLDCKFGYEGAPDKIAKCTVTVTIGVGLATWDKFGTRKAADAEWTRFVKALKVHEDGHVAIAKKDLEKVADLTIGKTEDEAIAAVQAAIDASTAGAQAAYDAKNGHGATQQAVLDPSKDPRPAQDEVAPPDELGHAW